MTLKVAITDDWLGVAKDCADWGLLGQRAELLVFTVPFATEDEAAKRLRDCAIILPMRERLRFDRSLLQRLPQLRMLALTGFQTQHVDMAYCAQHDVTVCGSGYYSPAATAELTLGLILAAQRDLVAADAEVRSGRFQQGLSLGKTLDGGRLGIIGLGRIGARVARYGLALGMDVVAWSPNLTEERCAECGVRWSSRDDLLASADVVTLHVPDNLASRGMIDAEAIARMKQGALLVNTARASLIDSQAMIVALAAGHIRAALDVFDAEPVASDDPLLKVSGTILSPHLGFSARPGLPLFYQQSLENILAFLDGAPIRVLGPSADQSN